MSVRVAPGTVENRGSREPRVGSSTRTLETRSSSQGCTAAGRSYESAREPGHPLNTSGVEGTVVGSPWVKPGLRWGGDQQRRGPKALPPYTLCSGQLGATRQQSSQDQSAYREIGSTIPNSARPVRGSREPPGYSTRQLGTVSSWQSRATQLQHEAAGSSTISPWQSRPAQQQSVQYRRVDSETYAVRGQ